MSVLKAVMLMLALHISRESESHRDRGRRSPVAGDRRRQLPLENLGLEHLSPSGEDDWFDS
jgi:hypothetical protein